MTRQRHHAFDYIEITVSDLPAAQGFYAEAFGWSFTSYGPGYAGIQSVDDPAVEVGGLALGDIAAGGAAQGPLVLLFSADLDASVEAIIAAGGLIVNGPYAFPGGRRVHFTDPSGNELGVWAER